MTLWLYRCPNGCTFNPALTKRAARKQVCHNCDAERVEHRITLLPVRSL